MLYAHLSAAVVVHQPGEARARAQAEDDPGAIRRRATLGRPHACVCARATSRARGGHTHATEPHPTCILPVCALSSQWPHASHASRHVELVHVSEGQFTPVESSAFEQRGLGLTGKPTARRRSGREAQQTANKWQEKAAWKEGGPGRWDIRGASCYCYCHGRRPTVIWTRSQGCTAQSATVGAAGLSRVARSVSGGCSIVHCSIWALWLQCLRGPG